MSPDAVIGLQYCLVAQNRSADAVAFVDEFIAKNPNLEASQALQLRRLRSITASGSMPRRPAPI